MRNGRLVPGVPVTGKYLLKKNGERFFSAEFLHRQKRGFEVPVQDWFKGPDQNETRERLAGNESPLRDYFRQDALAQIVEHARLDRVSAWRAWSLLVLQEWLQQAGSRTSAVT